MSRLPDSLYAALQARLSLSPLATLKAGYAALSRDYRVRTVSEGQREDLDGTESGAGGRLPGGYTRAQGRALGYMAARFPATYAAVEAALAQVPDAALGACESVLDLGAGPGTATWALKRRLPGLKSARLLESNAEMLAHAQALALAVPDLKASFHSGDLGEQLKLAPAADLVMLAYVLSEWDEAAQEALLQAAWDKARKGLFLLEPGTPETSRRVLAARAQWVGMGGRLIAPCPQSGPCPMDPARGAPAQGKGRAANAADATADALGVVGPKASKRRGADAAVGEALPWCHFSVRLERRGLHRVVKGGDLGYEDEKFSWIYIAKDASVPVAAPYRLHADPRRVNRNINLDVCDAEGRRGTLFYKRRAAPFGLRHAARQLKWGDAWNPAGPWPEQEADEASDL